MTGRASASAGDLDGDGVDDLVLGARGTSTNGVQSGSAYVIFGKTTAFAATFDLATLDGVVGFELRGPTFSDQAGWSIEGGGDFNNDGIEDLLVGAPFADPFGNSNAGAAYVIYGRADPMTLVGGAGGETLTGGAAADSLSGMGGQDILEGRGGDDTLDGGDMSDLLNGGAGADDLIGGSGGDVLNGDDGADDLYGGDGHDKLFGGLDWDDMVGGLGNDRFEGGGGVDALFGLEGNDYLDGGIDGDVLFGGVGNDIYLIDNGSDQAFEAAGEGYDIVRTALNGWVLGDNFEGLELGGGDIDGSGNALANNLQGGGGANTLVGEAGNDTINGNDGDDVIIGGLGGDLLRGGTGLDWFVVTHAFGAILETDHIYDFSTAEGDTIDLSGVDADTGTAGDQAFTLVSAFSKAAGQMTLAFAGGLTTLRLDVNGDGRADYQMRINGDVTADSGGWLL
eukprot:gene34517-biopygen18247